MKKKVQRSTLPRSADRPEIELEVACDVTRPDNLSGLVTSQATLNSISGRSTDRRRVLLWTFFHYFFSSFKWLSQKKIVKYPDKLSVAIKKFFARGSLRKLCRGG